MYVFVDKLAVCVHFLPIHLLNVYCWWIIVTDKHHSSLPSFALGQNNNKPWQIQQFLWVWGLHIMNQMQED
jgi:hypothetical protein